MVYFTADNHITKYRDGDESVRCWNEVVSDEDTVYIVGDLFSHNIKDPEYYLDRLQGKKILIIGNNDPFWLVKMSKEKQSKYFESVSSSLRITAGQRSIGFSHFPKKSFRTDVFICGHLHASKVGSGPAILRASNMIFNVGEILCNYRPSKFSEIIGYNESFYERNANENEKMILDEIISVLG